MKELIARIDEDFASSPMDGCCVLSIDDWQTLKSVVVANTSTNSAMVPCEAHIGAGRECVVLSGRVCNDYPCRIMAQHQ
jgi:hypothetical protein